MKPACRFNPRPPLLAGDAPCITRIDVGSMIVSIRARHCWRAMREQCLAKYLCISVSIRARHCWRAMR